jgi:pimeloyl-ACP methyl ester carboxylesterase
MLKGRVSTDDGAMLDYQQSGDPAAPTVVFANGIGVDHPGARLQRQALDADYHVVTWDYRGVAGSTVPSVEGDVSMGRHARDLVCVLDHAGVKRAAVIGWSMGVQVGLELARHAPERLSGFCALLGAHGRPFREAFPRPLAALMEGLFDFASRNPAIAQAPLDAAVALPELAFRVLSLASFVGADADRSVFDGNVASVQRMNRRVYLRTMLALAEHDARDVLPTLRCPALVIAGSRDHLTPPKVAHEMVAQIPGAEYREVEGGTHFALIEQPELINGWLHELMARVATVESHG